MVHLLLKWVLGALALLAVTYIVPGFRVVSLPSALVAVLVIGFLNMTLGLLLKVITFPFAILTLGLIFLVINAFMLILASKITPDCKSQASARPSLERWCWRWFTLLSRRCFKGLCFGTRGSSRTAEHSCSRAV